MTAALVSHLTGCSVPSESAGTVLTVAGFDGVAVPVSAVVVAVAVDAAAAAEESVVALSEKFEESSQGRVGYSYKCYNNFLKITLALDSVTKRT